MNKKIKIIIIVVSIVIILTVITLLCNKNSNGGNSNKLPLVVTASYRMKYGATFEGTVIFDDGSIYTWYYSALKSEYNGYIGNYSMNTKEGFKEFILDKGKQKDSNVSNSDLRKIKSIINKLNKEDIKVDCEQDKYNYIITTIFKNDEVIKLDTSDYCDKYGSNKNVSELLSIVKKY